MSLATLNGLEVIDLRLSMPRVGVWHAEVTCASDETTDTPVDFVIGEQLELHGHARAQGVAFDTLIVDLIGGKGDLGALAPARNYRNAALSNVLSDLLDAAGEEASDTILSSVNSFSLPRWSTNGGRTVGVELDALAALIDGTWRALPDGSIWLGVEKWKAADFDFEILRTAPQQRELVVVSDDAFPLPGQSLSNAPWPNLSYVLHELLNGSMRTTLYFEDG